MGMIEYHAQSRNTLVTQASVVPLLQRIIQLGMNPH
jgi:hypothetical protein